ncbi:Ger(x)C family spore germination protein (plasmid) [Paenibacillus rhizovicinus]|uniref:Ger(X)C family spore germination protein n=1 Tax=Paenibacillus rhizovicinus TaxID=2704463 RepID=A0A6C0PAN5_9BACL|nr:Ger(x)C family spore germination protein [Paenibacillus rhizovicinus]QHW35588.1 Ger(x)C family spore germination protein [Paenibacillus rhizovicinus]
MKRFNLIFLVVLVLSLPFTLHLKANVLEKLGMVIASGYDKVDGNKIKGTYVLHQIDPSSKSTILTITSESLTSKGARVAANRQSHKKVVAGQMRVVIYDYKLAQSGLSTLVDTLFRDASVASTIYMAVSKESAEDLLTHKYTQFSDVGSFIVDDIQQNILGEQMISGTLHEFLSALYSTADPMVPLLQRKGDSVELKNVALFNGDKLVGTVGPREAFFLKTIRDRYKSGSIELSLATNQLGDIAKNVKEKTVRIVIENIASSCTKKLISQNPLKFQVNIKMKGVLTESSAQLDFRQVGVIQTLQKKLDDESEKQIQILLKKLISLDSDPIGFGEFFRSRVYHSNLTSDKWHDMYKSASYDVHVDIRIVRMGQIQ